VTRRQTAYPSRVLGGAVEQQQGPIENRTRDRRLEAPERIDPSAEYLGDMHRDALKILAAGRHHRLQNSAQPRFDLSAEEIERSTGTVMRLADASRSQAKARGADSTGPA